MKCICGVYVIWCAVFQINVWFLHNCPIYVATFILVLESQRFIVGLQCIILFHDLPWIVASEFWFKCKCMISIIHREMSQLKQTAHWITWIDNRENRLYRTLSTVYTQEMLLKQPDISPWMYTFFNTPHDDYNEPMYYGIVRLQP